MVEDTNSKGLEEADRSAFFELKAEAKLLNDTRTGIKIRDFHQIVIDTMPEFGGGDAGPCPIELMLASLAGCVVETAIYLANKAGIRLGDVSSMARAIVVRRCQNYTIKSVEAILNARALSPNDLEIVKGILGLVEKYCIVANTLKKSVPVTVNLDVKDVKMRK